MSDTEAVIRWYLLLALVGAAGLPIGMMLLGEFRSRAIWFARPIGLLVLFIPTWFLSSAVDLPFTTTGLWATLVIAGTAGWLVVIRRGSIDRTHITSILTGELVTLGAFMGALWLRGFTPEILTTEKPMDAAFLSAAIRTDQMPPIDPFLAGETINYYYLGYALHGAIARMSDIAVPWAFNLALISTTAMVIAAVIGAVLIAMPRWGKYAAAFAAFLVVIAGNMDGPYRVLREGRDAWEISWGQGMGWNSSRVVYDGTIQTINEFPAFSIILGDLHPHLTALPFTIVALGLAFAFVRQSTIVSYPQLVGAGIIGGALYALNSWDLPTYFGLLLLACVWNLRSQGRRAIATRIGVAIASAIVAWAPFLFTFSPFVAGDPDSIPSALRDVPLMRTLFTTITANNFEYTSAGEFLRVFGLPYLLILITLAVAARDLPSALAGNQSMRNVGIIVALVAIVAILAGAPVLLLVGLPAAVAVWIVSRRGVEEPEGLVAALFLAGALIVILTEFFYIQDQFHDRMNTLFKAYYQVWTLWGIGAAIGLIWVLAEARRPETRTLVSAALAGSLVLGLVYPVTSAYRWTNEFDEWEGLNGTEYLNAWSPNDLAAIEWLRANASTDSVVVTQPGCSYDLIGVAPMSGASVFTGVPTIIGWTGHESQWRSGQDALQADLMPRVAEVQTFYREPTTAFLDNYQVDFVYYGAFEEGAGERGCEMAVALPRPDDQWMTQNGFSVAFQEGDVTIWQRGA